MQRRRVVAAGREERVVEAAVELERQPADALRPDRALVRAARVEVRVPPHAVRLQPPRDVVEVAHTVLRLDLERDVVVDPAVPAALGPHVERVHALHVLVEVRREPLLAVRARVRRRDEAHGDGEVDHLHVDVGPARRVVARRRERHR